VKNKYIEKKTATKNITKLQVSDSIYWSLMYCFCIYLFGQ
jgi:hypothetical protein